jgi:hypothetical protein
MPFGSFSPEGNSYSCVPLAKAVRPRYSKDMNSSLYLPFVTIIKSTKIKLLLFPCKQVKTWNMSLLHPMNLITKKNIFFQLKMFVAV